MADIFISYAREDRARAQQLAQAVDAQGWSVWWDVVIPAGRTFDEVIDEAIEAAKCVIVLWSHTSVNSRYVRGEAHDADEHGILVPVLIEDNVRIPRAFRAIQAANLVGWDGTTTARSFLTFVDDIARLLGPPPITDTKERVWRRAAETEERRAKEEQLRRNAENETRRKAELAEQERKIRQAEADAQHRANTHGELAREPDITIRDWLVFAVLVAIMIALAAVGHYADKLFR